MNNQFLITRVITYTIAILNTYFSMKTERIMAWSIFCAIIILNVLHRSSCFSILPIEAHMDQPNEFRKDHPDISHRAFRQKQPSNKYHEENDGRPPVDTNFSPRNVWRFELDVPEVLKNIKTYTGLDVLQLMENQANPKNVKRTGSSPLKAALNKKLQFEVKPPNMTDIVKGVQTLINGVTRSLQRGKAGRRFDRIRYGYTEESPGVVKSIVANYPPRYQEGRLNHLLELQKRRDRAKMGIQ